MPGQEFAVMFDWRRFSELFPIRADGPDTMRADGDDFLNLVLPQSLQIVFGELAESEIVAQAARWIARALFFAQDAKGDVQVSHHLRERGHDLAAPRVVRAHAAEPQAIFLAAVEDGQFLF